MAKKTNRRNVKKQKQSTSTSDLQVSPLPTQLAGTSNEPSLDGQWYQDFPLYGPSVPSHYDPAAGILMMLRPLPRHLRRTCSKATLASIGNISTIPEQKLNSALANNEQLVASSSPEPNLPSPSTSLEQPYTKKLQSLQVFTKLLKEMIQHTKSARQVTATIGMLQLLAILEQKVTVKLPDLYIVEAILKLMNASGQLSTTKLMNRHRVDMAFFASAQEATFDPEEQFNVAELSDKCSNGLNLLDSGAFDCFLLEGTKQMDALEAEKEHLLKITKELEGDTAREEERREYCYQLVAFTKVRAIMSKQLKEQRRIETLLTVAVSNNVTKESASGKYQNPGTAATWEDRHLRMAVRNKLQYLINHYELIKNQKETAIEMEADLYRTTSTMEVYKTTATVVMSDIVIKDRVKAQEKLQSLRKYTEPLLAFIEAKKDYENMNTLKMIYRLLKGASCGMLQPTFGDLCRYERRLKWLEDNGFLCMEK